GRKNTRLFARDCERRGFATEVSASDGDLVSYPGFGLRQWCLLHRLASRLLCPPPQRWIGDAVLSADLVERHIGDGELFREVRHRLGPDQFVELFTREGSGHDYPFLSSEVPCSAAQRPMPTPIYRRNILLGMETTVHLHK